MAGSTGAGQEWEAEFCGGRGERVEWEMKDRMRWDVEQWGHHSAKEKWKGILDTV